MELFPGICLFLAGLVTGVVGSIVFLFLVAEDHDIVDPEGRYHQP